MALSLVDKYRPMNTRQLLGMDYYVMSLTSWLRSWHTPQRQHKVAMLSGPTGIGKSMLAKLVCMESNIPNVVYVDSSRKRTKKALLEVEEAFMSRKVDAYITGKMQRSKPGAVIVDDLDAMLVGNVDKGGVFQLVMFVKKSRIPVICICNNSNSRSLKTLMSQCMHIRFVILGRANGV